MPYTWHISDPSIKPLFGKPICKHSVGAYIELHANVGRSFWAVHSHDTTNGSEGLTDPHSLLDISPPNRDLGAQGGAWSPQLLERLEQAKARTQNQTWANTESQTEMIKSIVQDAQTMIKMHQRLLPR
ncbi:hypothetical protein BJX96DRAFT_170018 [Aspergillus floccosus]